MMWYSKMSCPFISFPHFIAIEYTFQIMLFAFLHILTRNEAGQSDNVDQSYISC